MPTIKHALISTLLISFLGCSWIPARTIIYGGAKDIIDVPKGAKVCGVSLPTDEIGKTYCVVAQEESRLVSMKAWNIMEKSK